MRKGSFFILTDYSFTIHFFRSVRKIAKGDYNLRHVCIPVRLPAWNKAAPTGRIFLKFDMSIFQKSVEKIQVSLKCGKIIGTDYMQTYVYLKKSHEHQKLCVFITIFWYFDIFWYFADRASQYIYLNINQLDALNFIMSLFHASTCFEHYVLIVRRPKLYYTASGIITLCRCNDTRGCIVQF